MCTCPEMATWNVVPPCTKAIYPNKEGLSNLVCGIAKAATATMGPSHTGSNCLPEHNVLAGDSARDAVGQGMIKQALKRKILEY